MEKRNGRDSKIRTLFQTFKFRSFSIVVKRTKHRIVFQSHPGIFPK